MTDCHGIPNRNIYYMMAYAFKELRNGEYADVATEEFDHLHNLMAAILAHGLSWLFRRGLGRDYRACHDDIPTVRGKIDLSATLRNFSAGRRLMACDFDEMIEDTLPNRIIKATLRVLLRHGEVSDKHRTLLAQDLRYFTNVDTVRPESILWPAIHLPRHQRHYRPLLGVCQLTLTGLLMTTEDGDHRLREFLDAQTMSALYEKFILGYYDVHFDLDAKAPTIGWAGVSDDLLPRMETDVVLTKGGKSLIIDAKFYRRITAKRYGEKLRSPHLYQIYAYVRNAATQWGREVSGMLLYAGTSEGVQPKADYPINGAPISVRTLDLNREFKDIAAQLNEIAQEYFGVKLSE